MEARLQRRIQRYGWDRAASHYETSWKAQLAPAQALLLEKAALRPGEWVLDVACGTGLVTFPAARAVGPDGFVAATDLSDQMVAHVRAEAERRGLRYVAAEQADAEEIAYPDGSFDAALCGLGLMYFPDPVAAMRAQRRVMRPGGRAVAAVWGRRDRCGWAGVFPVVEARVASDVCPLFFALGTGDAMRATFEQAGFEDVAATRITTTLRYPSAEAACAAAFVGGPVAMAYARFDAQTRAEAHAGYLATIESFRSGRGYAIPGEFVVARGVRP
jgi:ubiquinone/menaquinone biosynthesis C-methylase UbiE